MVILLFQLAYCLGKFLFSWRRNYCSERNILIAKSCAGYETCHWRIEKREFKPDERSQFAQTQSAIFEWSSRRRSMLFSSSYSLFLLNLQSLFACSFSSFRLSLFSMSRLEQLQMVLGSNFSMTKRNTGLSYKPPSPL
jgi:hypothetical protein